MNGMRVHTALVSNAELHFFNNSAKSQKLHQLERMLH